MEYFRILALLNKQNKQFEDVLFALFWKWSVFYQTLSDI